MRVNNAIYRQLLLTLAFLMAGCASKNAASTFPDSTPAAELEKEIWNKVNEWRVKQGMPSLAWSVSLAELARRYSEDMGKRQFFSHTDPDGRNVKERLLAAGIRFRKAGENLARITPTPFMVSQLLSAWVKSQSHRQNLLEADFEETGIGLFCPTEGECYVTQIFVRPS